MTYRKPTLSFVGSSRSRARFFSALLRAAALGLPLAGCASLPSNGPTARRIVHEVRSPANRMGYQIIDIDPDTIRSIQPPVPSISTLNSFAGELDTQRSDVIHVGDTLSVSIFEVGVSLFGAPVTVATADMPSASAQRIGIVVDDEGRIRLPYVGPLSVAGRTPEEVQGDIETRLHGLSQHPQALVLIIDSVQNSIYVSGAITKPGRIRLSAAKERLLDAIALSGGPSVDIEDAEILLVRGNRTGQIRLSDLRAQDAANIILAPGDRIQLLKDPRTFSVFGATDKVSQIPFATHSVSLSDAIARSAGPSDSRADPRNVFLFRYEIAAGTSGEKPVIYHLDMMNPQSYFLAQRFAIRNGDVLYFSNSPANAAAKFINLLNQLVSPAVTARVLTQ